MKTITIGDKKIELNIGEQLTVKEFRAIYPIVKEKGGNEMEMVVEVVKAFSDDPEIEAKINSMNMKEFEQLAEEISKLIDQKKK